MITPYNPKYNGIGKGKNITVMEVVKTMLHDQDLLMHLWEEATSETMYVQNYNPHWVLNNKNPKESFQGEKP